MQGQSRGFQSRVSFRAGVFRVGFLSEQGFFQITFPSKQGICQRLQSRVSFRVWFFQSRVSFRLQSRVSVRVWYGFFHSRVSLKAGFLSE